MNKLLIIFLILLIGVNFVLNGFNDDFKAFLHNQLSCAVDYYKNKALYYYGRMTGRIPSELAIKNPREWSRFEIVYDALLLDPFFAEDFFTLYIESRKEVLDEMKPLFERQRDEWRSSRRTPALRSVDERKAESTPRRPPIQQWEETAVARLKEKMEERLSPGEWDLASDILKRFWEFPPIV
ncbi:MAG: hypothetical protein ACP5I1_12355, partial [Candidatus Hinthialibacter sp.]